MANKEFWRDRTSKDMPPMRLLTSVLIVGRKAELFSITDAADVLMLNDINHVKAKQTAAKWIDKQEKKGLIEPIGNNEYVIVDAVDDDAELHAWFHDLTDDDYDDVADLAEEIIDAASLDDKRFSYILWKMMRRADLPFRSEVAELVREILSEKTHARTSMTKNVDSSLIVSETEEQDDPYPEEDEPPVMELFDLKSVGFQDAPLPEEPPEKEPPPEPFGVEALILQQAKQNRLNSARNVEVAVSPQDFHNKLLNYTGMNDIDFGPGDIIKQPHRSFFTMLAGMSDDLDDSVVFSAIKIMTVYSEGPLTSNNSAAVHVLSECGLVSVEKGRWRRLS